MQNEEWPHGLCARSVSQLWPDVPRYDDAPGDKAEPDAGYEEQDRQRHINSTFGLIRWSPSSRPSYDSIDAIAIRPSGYGLDPSRRSPRYDRRGRRSSGRT